MAEVAVFGIQDPSCFIGSDVAFCKLVEGVTAGRVSKTLPSFFSQQHLGEVPKQIRGSSDLYLKFVKAEVFSFPLDFRTILQDASSQHVKDNTGRAVIANCWLRQRFISSRLLEIMEEKRDRTGSTKDENWRFLVSHLLFDISGFVPIDMVQPHKVVASDSAKLQIVGPVGEGIDPNVDAFDPSLVLHCWEPLHNLGAN